MTAFLRIARVLGMGFSTVCVSLIPGLLPTSLSAQTITTIAGNGIGGYMEDGFPAIDSYLYGIRDITRDDQGNLYFTSTAYNRVRKIDTQGRLYTIGGNGNLGITGDGGPAKEAALASPERLAVDKKGNVYFAEFGSHRIRKIDPAGILTTVVGNGTETFGGDGGPAIKAGLRYPNSVVIDEQGNFYIGQHLDNCIRKVDINGIITTVAGNGLQGFSGDGGPATQARLNSPDGITVDAQGNLYIADVLNARIRKVDTNGIITTVAGVGSHNFGGDGGPATQARLDLPIDVAIDPQGNLIIADMGNHRIRKVDAAGIIRTIAGIGGLEYDNYGGYGDGGAPTEAIVWDPTGLVFDPQGNLFIAAQGEHRVRKITIQTIPLATVSFSLINAETNQVIKQLTSGEQLDLASLPTRKLNIRANNSPAGVGSVVMQLSGTQSRKQTERFSPYALFEDSNGSGNYNAWQPATGSYTLTARPYTQPGAKGVAGTPLTITFSVIDQTELVDFTLMNADTDQPIQPLTDGAVIDLASLTTPNLSVRANTAPPTAGVVILELEDQQTHRQIEQQAPYALFGDREANYHPWKPAPGNYTLTASLYTTVGRDRISSPLRISFRVINPAPSARQSGEGQVQSAGLESKPFPNPFRESFRLKSPGPGPLVLYDRSGRKVFELDSVQDGQLIAPGAGLAPGFYLLQLGEGPRVQRRKLLKVD